MENAESVGDVFKRLISNPTKLMGLAGRSEWTDEENEEHAGYGGYPKHVKQNGHERG
jgi:hypothetical protein